MFEFEQLTYSQNNLKNVKKTIEKISNDSLFDLKINEVVNFTNQKQSYKKGNRNNFIYLLAKNCIAYGLNESDFQNFITDNYAEDDFSADEIQNSIDIAHKHCLEDFNNKTKLRGVKMTFENLVTHYSSIFSENTSKEDYNKFLVDDNVCLGVAMAVEAIAKNELKKMG